MSISLAAVSESEMSVLRRLGLAELRVDDELSLWLLELLVESSFETLVQSTVVGMLLEMSLFVETAVEVLCLWLSVVFEGSLVGTGLHNSLTWLPILLPLNLRGYWIGIWICILTRK